MATPTKRSHRDEDAIEPSDTKSPRTPTRRAVSSKVVTPAEVVERKIAKNDVIATVAKSSNARRSLSMSDDKDDDDAAATSQSSSGTKIAGGRDHAASTKKLPFGGGTKPIDIPPNVQRVYTIVKTMTGSIGGNSHGGAIYGELTVGSMQKMTNLMIEYADLSTDSRFIDVGCGLGKPNLHVAQYPGVDFSYGIEMEHIRWMLGMSNLDHVLKAAVEDEVHGNNTETKIGHHIHFAHGDITEAEFFDPFTHVYMFDIGFPPRLFYKLAEMYNKSQSEYLICFHGPRLMIDEYGFHMELVVQSKTLSMHGSAEGHTGYIYRRSYDIKSSNVAAGCKTKTHGIACDPLFAKAWELCRGSVKALSKFTSNEVERHWGETKKRVTRSSAGEQKKSE